MNVQVTARRFKAHDSLREYAQNEVSKLERYFDNIIGADVILSFEKPRDSVKTAEISLSVYSKKIIAKESSDDFIKSIDLAVAKLERQLNRYKSKKRDKKRSSSKVLV
ncbi:MAG: ribosome-associated translation inhibitor RaiA [Ignavibacteria bacterium]|nr:ribosome-associated translation inhibitor RaiA [Ignavibacteria bacterium]